MVKVPLKSIAVSLHSSPSLNLYQITSLTDPLHHAKEFQFACGMNFRVRRNPWALYVAMNPRIKKHFTRGRKMWFTVALIYKSIYWELFHKLYVGMTINPPSTLFAKLAPAQFWSLTAGYSKLWWKCSEKLRRGRFKAACNWGKVFLGFSSLALPLLGRASPLAADLPQIPRSRQARCMSINFRQPLVPFDSPVLVKAHFSRETPWVLTIQLTGGLFSRPNATSFKFICPLWTPYGSTSVRGEFWYI